MPPRKVKRKHGHVWEVRYRAEGRHKSRAFDRKADAEDFAAEVRRLKRLGVLRTFTPAMSCWPTSASSGGAPMPSRTSRPRPFVTTAACGTATYCRDSAATSCARSLRRWSRASAPI